MFKSKLQEWCMKKYHQPPTYTTSFLKGDAHSPTWKSVVKVADGTEYSAVVNGSKKKAENKVAKDFLSSIGFTFAEEKDVKDSSSLSPSKIMKMTNICLSKKTYLFVDLENRGDFKSMDVQVCPTDQVIGFVAKGNVTFETMKDRMKLINVHSSRKDAADIGMVVEGTRMMSLEILDTLLVLSNDAFAETWKEVSKKMFPEIDIKTFTNIKSLESFLRKS